MPPIEKGLGIAGMQGKQIEGIPNETQILKQYQLSTPISLSTIQSWYGFYLAFLCFKNIVIVHGVKQRLFLGVASSKNAGRVVELLPHIVEVVDNILKVYPPPMDRSKL